LLKTPKFAALYANENIRSKINEVNAFGTKGVLSGCLSAIDNSYLSGNYMIIHTLEMMVKSLLNHSHYMLSVKTAPKT